MQFHQLQYVSRWGFDGVIRVPTLFAAPSGCGSVQSLSAFFWVSLITTLYSSKLVSLSIPFPTFHG